MARSWVVFILRTKSMLGLRDADERIRAADRSCVTALDAAAASATYRDVGELLSC